MKIKYWCLKLNNYEGADDVVYFENYEIAKKNFDIVCEKHKNEDEFEQEEESCSWFDCGYNEYSTFVQLLELSLPTVYNKIVF